MTNFSNLLDNNKVSKIFGKFSVFAKFIISGLTFLVFLYLSLLNLNCFSLGKKTDDVICFISYGYDNIIVNVLSILLILIIIYTLLSDFLEKFDYRIFFLVLSIYIICLGVFWIITTDISTRVDQKTCLTTAIEFSQNNYDRLSEGSYFCYYSYQLGFVAFCQIIIALFKENHMIVIRIINIISLIMIYLAIIKISEIIFNKNKKIINTTILLLFFCIQPIMFCTFIYGFLIGFAFGLWAIYFLIKFIKCDNLKKSILFIIVSLVLLAISIILKPNNKIIMIAMVIILLINFLDNKKLISLLVIPVLFVFGTFPMDIIISTYESKANFDLGDGVPQIAWANIGLHQATNTFDNNGYGWYKRDYSAQIFKDTNFNCEETSKIVKEQIIEQLEYFKKNPQYTSEFFTKKILSTWANPTYDCIWVNETCAFNGELNEFVKNVYYGNYNKWIIFITNLLQNVIFIFSLIFFIVLFKKKDVSLYIMPLIILGGFLYHLIFETKSYYVMNYFILLVPMASYGINIVISQPFLEKVKNIFKQV